MHTLRQFILFSRPHTIIGTTLSVTTLFVLASHYAQASVMSWSSYGWALLSCLGANVYIVGLNQLTDVAIDRINKPYLPLASGAYSIHDGIRIVGVSLIMSVTVALWQGGFLLATVLLSLLLGTAYSMPPVRLKRFTFWAAFCIIAVRGLIVNFLLFLHFHRQLSNRTDVPTELYLLAGIIFGFSIIIAWFKDVPDMAGDESHRIRTLSLRLGARRVFTVGNFVLSLTLLGAVYISLTFPLSLSMYTLAGGQLLLLLALWLYNSLILAQADQRFATVREWFPTYYQFIWVLFFSEYILFAVASL